MNRIVSFNNGDYSINLDKVLIIKKGMLGKVPVVFMDTEHTFIDLVFEDENRRNAAYTDLIWDRDSNIHIQVKDINIHREDILAIRWKLDNNNKIK